MNIEMLERAAQLAKTVGYAFIATASSRKIPHIGMASDIGVDFQGRLEVTGWFCQFTEANLQENRSVTVVIWDPRNDEGYQVVGEMERVDEIERTNGFLREAGKESAVPQIERMLHIKVRNVLGFKKAPHLDAQMKI
jgi:hypothetical protein